MPWCEDCAKYWTPNSMNDDGTCPTCGRVVEPPTTGHEGVDGDDDGAPWHFKLLVATLVVYLGWRFVQIFA
jgi:hypothetical protein